jgi:dihydropteroate synthase
MAPLGRTVHRANLAGVEVGDGLPVVVMGALNVSPESFHAGSVHLDREGLVRAATAMVDAGAAMVDVGARSTAPYLNAAIDEGEEADRLAAAVELLTRKLAVPVSADTARARPARAALEAGARVVNDVAGLRDAGLAALVAEHGAGLIAMAAPDPGAAPAGGPIATVQARLAGILETARAAGIGEERVVLDPGIGFFRDGPLPWHAWDVQVLAGLRRLAGLGRPLCVGVSRKSFVGALTGRAAPADRLAGSLAATAAAVLAGAALIRTHDVAETVDAVRVAERVREAGA